MTEGEIKEYPHGPVTLTVAPTMFDLSKAKRVKITKEDLELKEQEEEARKQAALWTGLTYINIGESNKHYSNASFTKTTII